MVAIMAEDISKKLCNRCHRLLKDKKSIELGFGPTCYKKHLEKQKNYLFDLPTERVYTKITADDISGPVLSMWEAPFGKGLLELLNKLNNKEE